MSVDSLPASEDSLVSSSLDSLFASILSEPTSFDAQNFELDWNQEQHFSDEEQNLFPDMSSSVQVSAAPMADDPFMPSALVQENEEHDSLLEFSFNPNDLTIHIDLDKEQEEIKEEEPAVFYSASSSSSSSEGEEEMMEEVKEDPDWAKENTVTHNNTKPQRAKKPSYKTKQVEAVQKVTGGRVQKKTRRGRKKPAANAWLLGQKAPVAKAKASGKRLYEQETPFDDPELERCRLNALCAKQNREKKKREQEALVQEMEDLRSENERLRREREAASSDREELQRLREVLRRENLLDQVYCTKRHSSQRAREACKVCSKDSEE